MQAKRPPSVKMMVGAAGVVFGDIGTSPLYAFQDSFTGRHKLAVDPFHVMGVLSMLVWALILVVTVKYVFVTMRADNRGEGGSFALLSLISRVAKTSPAIPWIAAAALTATALFYGDAVITPAISILSAVEGVKLIASGLEVYIIPATLVIVVGLFAVQRYGTNFVGSIFGPLMVVWFVVIGVLGGVQIFHNPVVLKAASPTYALRFLLGYPVQAFFTLGTVVLAVTGAEALYADMGHFGRPAISRAWLWMALPTLLLCYAGQSALVLANPAAISSPFYLMAPRPLLIPLIVLASIATVIASQSIISGAFSITQQAVQLGYLPRITTRHTSSESRGQVFTPAVNVLLAIAVVGLVLGFRSSDALAAAFGLAVTATMVLTTLMAGFVVFFIWRWKLIWAGPLYAVLLALDVGLFAASATKFTDGGWLPLSIAAVLVLIFATWRRGRQLLHQALAADAMDLQTFLASTTKVMRVPATAIYLTANKDGIPAALLHNLKNNLVLHARTVLLTVETALTPHVAAQDRVQETPLGEGFSRIVIRYGFVEIPDIPAALAAADLDFNPKAAAFFLSRQTLIPSKKPGMPVWQDHLFAAMVRNSETPMMFFKLPINRVVELGSQVEI